ncbi:MAG: peptidylprolyl isomerase [Verrucomicrobiota bacterium]|nr:peptidylprolyl isomerase [Verrucomicrobiota bacterium]
MTIRVNGETIPQQAIDYEFQRLARFYSGHLNPEELRRQTDALRQNARDQAVGMKLLIAEANRLDLPVSEEDLDERYRKVESNAGGAARFEEMMRKQGLTRELVRENIRIGRGVDKLVERIVAGIANPSEEEVRAHFEAHAAEYRAPERAQAQHILIKPDSGRAEDREAAKSKLLEIKRRIEAGADFADEAAAHSQCPSGRKAGGSLGWLIRGAMVPAIDEAAFAMRVGELSDPVETKMGFHLLRKSAEEPSRPAELDEVRDRIREFLRHARRGEAIAAYVEELKGKAKIEGL